MSASEENNGVEEPQVDVNFILNIYQDARLEEDPGYDSRVLEKMKEICSEMATDFAKLERPGQESVSVSPADFSGSANATDITKQFFEYLKSSGGHKYDILTLGGALFMSLKCMQEATYVYNPAEFLAQSLYIMAFRNREDDFKSFKALESATSSILNRHIREFLWNLHRCVENIPEALEARFYYETPFDVDMDHLQAILEDSTITPTMDAATFMCNKQRRDPTAGIQEGACGGADAVEALMNAVQPMVDAAQQASKLSRGCTK